jgi:electron transfer flavoprotein beta subunit
MRILVPVKRVIDPYARVRALPDGSGIDVVGAKFEVNPFDEIALEEAVRMREKGLDVEIVAVSIGSSACEEQLRKALAMGADRAILIEAEEALDSYVVAEELYAVAQELQPDLILMGKQATDDDANQVGQRLAAKLDWPQATFAAKIEIDGTSLIVKRETDDGEETLALQLPAVVTTDLRLNEPRYIALPGIIKARGKPLERRPRATDARVKVRIVSYENPAPRPAGRKVANVDELVAAIHGTGVLG